MGYVFISPCLVPLVAWYMKSRSGEGCVEQCTYKMKNKPAGLALHAGTAAPLSMCFRCGGEVHFRAQRSHKGDFSATPSRHPLQQQYKSPAGRQIQAEERQSDCHNFPPSPIIKTNRELIARCPMNIAYCMTDEGLSISIATASVVSLVPIALARVDQSRWPRTETRGLDTDTRCPQL